MMFGAIANLWKLICYSPKKEETLANVHTELILPEMKIFQPSNTRWLSHEQCRHAIRKELPAVIVTLQQLYESSGGLFLAV